MTRRVIIFVLFLALPTGMRAEAAQAGFNAQRAERVWGAALSYIQPRALLDLKVSTMTIWGLGGITALDPNLTVALQNGQIQLSGPAERIFAVQAPHGEAPQAWAHDAALVSAAAYDVSVPLRQAGTGGVIESFFDELFDHFDPYSRYEPPARAAEDELMVGGAAGTGITLARQDGGVAIGAVALDSPAALAGLEAGATVLAINARPTRGARLDQLAQSLLGNQGSIVTLRLRDLDGAISDVPLTRADVPPQTVFADNVGPGILGLRITGFDSGTSDQLTQAIAAGLSQNPAPRGLVIDLRGNRGGVLRQAILSVEALLPAGTIAETVGRDPDADQVWSAEGSDETGGLPMVLLVDGQTASAAEIFSAALADNGRAVVVGSETLGKGLVQTVTSLPDGGELFVTWSRVLAPLGWPLQTMGVMPQVCTSNPGLSLDQQFSDLVAGRNAMAAPIAAARALRAPAPIQTILGIRDNCPAAVGGDADKGAARTLIDTPGLYRAALIRLPAGAANARPGS